MIIYVQISNFSSKFSQLRTLNIRNLPAAPKLPQWLHQDRAVEALASLLVDVINIKALNDRRSLLETIGLGAFTYSDKIGLKHGPSNGRADFFRLRIYHIDHKFPPELSQPHLIATGTPDKAFGCAKNLDIFKIYWLDTAPNQSIGPIA